MSIAPEQAGAAVVPVRAGGPGRPSPVSVAGEILGSAGVLVLLFVVWQVWWTDVSAASEARRLTGGLESSWAADPVGPGADTMPVPGGAFAVMQIPALGRDWSWPVLEGTDAATLRRGLGHYPGTALPGEIGNMAVAGHRTTYGRPLHDVQDLREGDAVVILTRTHRFTYRVTGHEIVAPWQTDVVLPEPGRPGVDPTRALLTLTTCHPAYSASRRYVVRAVLDAAAPRTAG